MGSGVLAQAHQPPPTNNYSIAGDIVFNTTTAFNIGTTHDLFTVAMHEFSHALGMDHSTSPTAAMYATYDGAKPGLSSDDIAGIRSIYSNNAARSPDAYDAVASNGTFATATNLNSLINSTTLKAVVNKLDITTTSDIDYYTFTAPQGTSSTVNVTVQSTGLSLLAPLVTVYAADQKTVLGTASGLNHYGTTLSVSLSGVTAGKQFYDKVQGASTDAFGTGRYALSLNFANSTSQTVTQSNPSFADTNPLCSSGDAEGKPVSDLYGALVLTLPSNTSSLGVNTTISAAVVVGNTVVITVVQFRCADLPAVPQLRRDDRYCHIPVARCDRPRTG